jgi:hypothetical protein
MAWARSFIECRSSDSCRAHAWDGRSVARPPEEVIAKTALGFQKFGQLAIFTSVRRASSLLSNLAADRFILEIDIGERLAVVTAHDKAGI